VADALDQRSGVHVIQYGASGFSAASIRGTGVRHTAVYLDGLLVSDPQSNQLDLGLIPVVMLQSVEIHHGPSSASDGHGSLGGSVRLETLEAGNETLVRLGLEAGEFGHRRVGGAVTGSAGRLSIITAGELSRYEGDYPYVNPTLIEPTEQRRSGGDRSSSTLFASAEYREGRHQLKASGWFNAAERGLPGPANAPPTDARQWDDNTRIWLKSEHGFGLWNAHLSLDGAQSRLRYANPSAARFDTTTTHTADARATVGRSFGSNLVATSGASLGVDRTTGVSETRAAVFGDAIYESARLLVYPSIRYERWMTESRTLAAFVPRIGMNLRLDGRSRAILKANVGRAYRVPSFLERFWKPGGNPGLNPERGWSLDAGIRLSDGPQSASHGEVSLFYTDLNDKIVWFPSLVDQGLQLWRPDNLGRVVTYGAELSGESKATWRGAQFKGGFSTTFSRAIDRSDPDTPSYGKQLRYTPCVTGSLFMGVLKGPLSVHASARYTGERFLTSDEGRTMDDFAVVNLQVAYQHSLLDTELTLRLQVENLFDTRYEVIRFYPMPPRTATLGISIETK
jgi:iron complex outermembrane receptor protein